MPSIRTPLPSGLGISTFRTGEGRYVPSSSSFRMASQRACKQGLQFFDGHAVDARSALVAHHPLVSRHMFSRDKTSSIVTGIWSSACSSHAVSA